MITMATLQGIEQPMLRLQQWKICLSEREEPGLPGASIGEGAAGEIPRWSAWLRGLRGNRLGCYHYRAFRTDRSVPVPEETSRDRL